MPTNIKRYLLALVAASAVAYIIVIASAVNKKTVVEFEFGGKTFMVEASK